MSERPLIIAGAGAAGLSLAVHLLEKGYRRSMVLLEPRESYEDDRTWCYWHFDPHPFEACVSHRWNRWRVPAPGRDVAAGSTRHPYCHISGADFYSFALERLEKAPNVSLRLGTRVLDAIQQGSEQDPSGGVRVETSAGAIDGHYLFDSRPRPVKGGLVQHFVGLFLEAERDLFEPGVVTLMDFTAPRPFDDRSGHGRTGAGAEGAHSGDAHSGGARLDGVHFVYVLPFSRTRALVESTLFTPHGSFQGLRAHEREHRQAVRAYLDRHYAEAGMEVMRQESGAIPMAVVPPATADSRIVPIGTAAGCARASSGYAFDAVQRTSRGFAEAVMRGEPPAAVPIWRTRARWLDRIFLSFLEHRPELAPRVFASLFERLPGDVMPRFLSDRETAGDVLRVMTTMPKIVFAREWLRTSLAPAA